MLGYKVICGGASFENLSSFDLRVAFAIFATNSGLVSSEPSGWEQTSLSVTFSSRYSIKGPFLKGFPRASYRSEQIFSAQQGAGPGTLLVYWRGKSPILKLTVHKCRGC
mgnify:CR=1 FL=1